MQVACFDEFLSGYHGFDLVEPLVDLQVLVIDLLQLLLTQGYVQAAASTTPAMDVIG